MSGNSKAVRIPASFALEPGTQVRVREERGRYVIEPVEAAEQLIDLTGIAGAIPSAKPLEQKGRTMSPRTLDWDRKLTGGA